MVVRGTRGGGPEVGVGEMNGGDRVMGDGGGVEGQRVVVAGVDRLREGDRVRILN